ncbi:MAG: peptidoglycan DD-metalloendopeptidase family protein [Saprospiraceae bacterium]
MKSKSSNFVRIFFFLLLSLMAFWRCSDNPLINKAPIQPKLTPWEAYWAALDSNGLAQTQMAKNWKLAGEKALNDSIQITSPFQETGYIQAEVPSAMAYAIELKTGEQLNISLSAVPDSLLFFVDLFQLEKTDSTSILRPVFHATPYQTDSISFEVEKAGSYIVRIQPELLVSARYTISMVTQAIYGVFPVSGKGNSAIWSFFGDPRDGGKRSHKGIDIFARRGTPVLAATDGTVRSVRDRGLGGKQVWLSDTKRSQSLYYAHLDSQLVREGATIKAGDTLGLVGNTGNARNTRPHLHFSIYRRGQGAIDPHPFVASQSIKLPAFRIDTTWLGQMVRVSTNKTILQAGPNNRSHSFATLNRHLPLKVIAGSQGWYRVSTPDGIIGYCASNSLEQINRPIRQIKMAQATELFQRPHPESPPISTIALEAEVDVLGQNETFQLVRGRNGEVGWMAR